MRLDPIGPVPDERPLATVVWADLLSQAGMNARPFARYLVFMSAAGIVATVCVVGGLMTFVLSHLNLLPTHLQPGQRAFLDGLSTVNVSTPIVGRRPLVERRHPASPDQGEETVGAPGDRLLDRPPPPDAMRTHSVHD